LHDGGTVFALPLPVFVSTITRGRDCGKPPAGKKKLLPIAKQGEGAASAADLLRRRNGSAYKGMTIAEAVFLSLRAAIW